MCILYVTLVSFCILPSTSHGEVTKQITGANTNLSNDKIFFSFFIKKKRQQKMKILELLQHYGQFYGWMLKLNLQGPAFTYTVVILY